MSRSPGRSRQTERRGYSTISHNLRNTAYVRDGSVTGEMTSTDLAGSHPNNEVVLSVQLLEHRLAIARITN